MFLHFGFLYENYENKSVKKCTVAVDDQDKMIIALKQWRADELSMRGDFYNLLSEIGNRNT